jgi:hypothetical protein
MEFHMLQVYKTHRDDALNYNHGDQIFMPNGDEKKDDIFTSDKAVELSP